MTTGLPFQYEPRLLLASCPEFPGVLALPRREHTPEGQLYHFRFDNGYGALVMHTAQGLDQTFELCLIDWTCEPAQPTFEHLICPEVLFGLSSDEVSALLAQAEWLPRHSRLADVDQALLSEDF